MRVIEARSSIGMLNVYDVSIQRSQLYTQLSQLISFTNNYIDQTAELARLMALPRNSLAIPSERAKTQGSWDKSLKETVDHAIKYREEILASLAAAESSEWSAIASLRKYLPVFSLSASGSLTGRNGYSGISVNQDPSYFFETNRTWDASAMVNFRWNIFFRF